jgi:hypothetical protein
MPAPDQQHAGALRCGLIQLEFGVARAVFGPGPVLKQKLAESGPLDPLQKLLRNDLVSIHVGPIHRHDAAGVFGERLHGYSLLTVLSLNRGSSMQNSIGVHADRRRRRSLAHS